MAAVPKPSLNRSTSRNELYRCNLNGIKCCPDDHELAFGPNIDQLGNRFESALSRECMCATSLAISLQLCRLGYE